MKKKPILTHQRALIAAGLVVAAGGVWLAARTAPPRDSGESAVVLPIMHDRQERLERSGDRPLKVLPVLAEKPSKEELAKASIERAEHDPEAAIAWAQSLAEPGDRETAVLAVASELVRTEPQQALELALKLPASATRDEVLERATREWAGNDPHAAVEWAREFSDEKLRPRLLGGAVLEWSQKEPAEAAAMAVDSMEAGKPLENLVVGIVQRWVQTEPDEATAWVADFPEGPLKDAAEANLAAIQAAKAAQAEELQEARSR